MQINITARDFGGTEFLAQPHRLHLGAQKAEGVDQLEFSLPEQWNGCVVTLHIRHADGTLAEPLALDETGCVSVGRSFTGWASGEWMLAAANGNGYTAYTRPGQYDVHGILPTEGGGEELTPSVYEQFIAQVVASANAAAEAARDALEEQIAETKVVEHGKPVFASASGIIVPGLRRACDSVIQEQITFLVNVQAAVLYVVVCSRLETDRFQLCFHPAHYNEG